MIDKEVLLNTLRPGVKQGAPTFIIFSEQINTRLNYVCEFIFNHVLKCNFIVTDNANEFGNSSFFKINYSQQSIEKTFTVLPHGLINEKGVSEVKPSTEIRNNVIYFFCRPDQQKLSFDIFSAVFYFISRYEEWQPFNKDAHERFELKESCLYKNNFHLKPVVDIWIEELKRELKEYYPSLLLPVNEFKTIATIDVDNLFAYKHKGFVRTIGAGLKDLLKFDLTNVMRRNRVINGVEEDPFDIYSSFSGFCKAQNIPLVYFFLFKTGTKYDRTVNPSSKAFTKVFDNVKKQGAFIGLHPSYYASVQPEVLRDEVKNFSQKTGQEVKLSRQHYLKFNIKTTPALLLKNGISVDFSMGFASGVGFRAGTSHPFYYYDFANETKTELLFVPFCAMDGAYFIYDNMSANDALTALRALKEEIKKVNGFFTTVFHERTFAEHLYPGFGAMYRTLLTEG